MFKGSRRIGGFNISTTLNTPIVIHKRGEPTHLSKDEVMQFLDKFISEKELLVASGGIESIGGGGGAGSGTGNGTGSSTNTMLGMDAGLSSSLAQLKRIQRDFKGLPPMSYEEEEEEQGTQATTETQTDAN